jgi:hypothetical protein
MAYKLVPRQDYGQQRRDFLTCEQFAPPEQEVKGSCPLGRTRKAYNGEENGHSARVAVPDSGDLLPSCFPAAEPPLDTVSCGYGAPERQ